MMRRDGTGLTRGDDAMRVISAGQTRFPLACGHG